ncbi:Phosphoribosylglycinamide formyltransferase 2 [Clostridium sp. N3C]|uniref:ATP-grasp domain-containing protein n=1 Tax=Clostridium sp. N3C TaxID=1776758 RepID=UPI00092DF750|nr:ATP-grasp domain-containing protein [Clostridium sp. N3C]SCN21295.1 Phosphoribosylglycinamide formyltransferase 2 [Clostridium sp. N3C]
MKRLLMLGGSHFQVPAIKKAREMGYYVITCDYLPENPGHKFSHEYHNVSTTDKEKVLNLAKELKIDGIVCYASDPAATTAAYVAEQLGLPTNPYKSVEILTNKDMFRKFLEENGFNVPRARGYSSINEAKKDFHNFKMPVMIKPVDSSGSKGVSKIDSIDSLEEKVEYALSFSRAKRFIIEEYIEKYGYQIEGDGFSVNGNLVFRCFANGHFENNSSNPFVPIGESWPYNMPTDIHNKIHYEIQRALSLLNMKTGAYNFDIRIDDKENVYLMEIGPRNGGNLIPQVTKYATGVDMVEFTIKAAMGEDCSDLTMIEPKGFWSCYMIHSEKEGMLKKVEIEESFKENNIVEFEMLYKPGDKVSAFTGSNGTLGTMILKYSSMEEMLEKMDNMSKWVKVIVE